MNGENGSGPGPYEPPRQEPPQQPTSPGSVRQLWQLLCSLPAKLLIFVVRLYQRGISPLLGPNCRYQPTCSEYMIQAVRKHGVLFGGWKGIWRILRCHPFSRGGYDPP